VQMGTDQCKASQPGKRQILFGILCKTLEILLAHIVANL
jgi:hypothetical protein